MKVIKICYLPTAPEDTPARLVRWAEEFSLRVDVQIIDNAPYVRWLKSSGLMPWNRIVNVFVPDDILFAACQQKLPAYLDGNADAYLIDQITYGTPIDGAEVITSCYLWNYGTDSALRSQTMHEHFLMEQQQPYYDYVAFQLVKDILTSHSPTFDFFFESHVSHPDGINQIYSKPALEGMREHSKVFLDTDTRRLSFGRVKVKERKDEV